MDFVHASDSSEQERFTEAADGTRIAYESSGRGSTALVFLHGWASDRTCWTNQVTVFAEQYRVVTLDLPGHGDSPSQRRKWSIQKLGEDVTAVAKAAGLSHVILIGHSMGGLVALAAAKRMRGSVTGVIGIETLHNVEENVPADDAGAIIKNLRENYTGAMDQLVRGAISPDASAAMNAVTDMARRSDPEVAIALIRTVAGLDMRRLLRAARVPVHCINAAPGGPGTQVSRPEINRKYGDFDVELISSTGHFIMMERPQELNARLMAAIRGLEAHK